MKPAAIIFSIGAFLFLSFITIRLTDTFNWYSVKSESGEPTYHIGDVIFVSRFKPPQHGRYLAFKVPDGSTYIHRCIGMPNDVIEIRNGDVYRNGQKLREPYVANEYLISKAQTDSLHKYIASKGDMIIPYDDEYNRTYFGAKELKALHLEALQRVITPKGDINEFIYKPFAAAGYNEDNLGPVKVPANSYFLMGDNRHNAMDSRYMGFIKVDKVIGTVLN